MITKSIFKLSATVLVFGLSLMACSKGQQGNWNINQYEVGAPGRETISITNLGKVTFDKDGTGFFDMKFPEGYVATSIDDKNFKWSIKEENFLVLEGANKEFAKTWIVSKEGNNKQTWKSTDGADVVQIIKVSR